MLRQWTDRRDGSLHLEMTISDAQLRELSMRQVDALNDAMWTLTEAFGDDRSLAEQIARELHEANSSTRWADLPERVREHNVGVYERCLPPR